MKILNINTDIGINTGLQYSFPLSIISAQSCYRNWIASNYIDLVGGNKQYEGDINNYHFYLDSYSYADGYNEHDPVLFQNGITTEILKSNKIHELLHYFIDNKQYIILFVDEYYLPNCLMGDVRHFLHEQLIYGYCEKNMIYYSVGFDKGGHYTLLEHSFKEIEDAYEKGFDCVVHGNINWAKDNRLISLKLPNYYGDLPLDKKRYSEKIRNYLSGTLDAKRHYFLTSKIKRYFYGISYYDIIIEDFHSMEAYTLFMHMNHLRDHKYMLKNSFQVYSDLKNKNTPFFLDEISEIFNSINLLRKKALKSHVVGKYVRDDFIDSINLIKNKEYDLLNSYSALLLEA